MAAVDVEIGMNADCGSGVGQGGLACVLTPSFMVRLRQAEARVFAAPSLPHEVAVAMINLREDICVLDRRLRAIEDSIDLLPHGASVAGE